jgi:hypothetical protein
MLLLLLLLQLLLLLLLIHGSHPTVCIHGHWLQ